MSVHSFHCSACGKCCNSPPFMSTPELFRHQHIFIGCLAIKRISRPRPGGIVRFGTHSHAFSSAECAAFAELTDMVAFKVEGPKPFDVGLFGHAFSYPAEPGCPALDDDGKCSIHDRGRPSVCAAAPLDPLAPDDLQDLVLTSRKADAGFFAADCIVEGERDDFDLVTKDAVVVEPGFRDALGHRRDALAAEKFWWGNDVFAMLRDDLFAAPACCATLPADGFFYVSLAPVLVATARLSAACQDRCLTYIDAQLALIDRWVAAAIRRKREADRPGTAQLRAWAKAYRQLQASLRAGSGFERARPRPGAIAWLEGLPAPP